MFQNAFKPTEVKTLKKLLQIQDLSTHFFTDAGILKAVDGISYDLGPGEILGVVGESGCGKSVSALSIMRLVPDPPGKIVNGRVLFNNRDLLRATDSEMRSLRGHQISMVFQEPMTSLNPVLTIGRQLTEPLELHLGMSKSQARVEACELLSTVGIADPEQHFDYYPHHLSGGMRQRVMIAMAISCKPKIIIADEPTTSLDVTIQAQILDLLQSYSIKHGTALIIITHNLGLLARYASSILVMYAGKVVETGSSLDIYQGSRHPYTLGLLHSVPRTGGTSKSKLYPIEGSAPDQTKLPAGCSFASRCRFADNKCLDHIPPLAPINKTHKSACWKSIDLPNITNGPKGLA